MQRNRKKDKSKFERKREVCDCGNKVEVFKNSEWICRRCYEWDAIRLKREIDSSLFKLSGSVDPHRVHLAQDA